MSDPEAHPVIRMEVREPRQFTWPAVLVLNLYGILLLTPALLSMFVVSTLPFSTWTYVLPLLALLFATFFLPFGFGNTYANRLAGSYKPSPRNGDKPVLVQITFAPRLRSGLRSTLEDADDIGWFYRTGPEIVFTGDSVSLIIPNAAIKSIRRQNGGWRGLFLYRQVCIETAANPSTRKFCLAERSSLFLPESIMVGKRLFNLIQNNVNPPAGGADNPLRADSAKD